MAAHRYAHAGQLDLYRIVTSQPLSGERAETH